MINSYVLIHSEPTLEALLGKRHAQIGRHRVKPAASDHAHALLGRLAPIDQLHLLQELRLAADIQVVRATLHALLDHLLAKKPILFTHIGTKISSTSQTI